jgi:hypothetical protein
LLVSCAGAHAREDDAGRESLLGGGAAREAGRVSIEKGGGGVEEEGGGGGGEGGERESGRREGASGVLAVLCVLARLAPEVVHLSL